MTREERNAISRQRIGQSALREFSQFGYAGASINDICSHGEISKGILYHYFKDKDALYLQCVEDCFTMLADFLRSHNAGGEVTLESYSASRLAFFRAHPQQHKLFCDAVITPPPHLREPILQRKLPLDEVNAQLLRAVLAKESLRPDISLEQAVDFYRAYSNFANASMAPDIESLYEIERYNEAVQLAVKLFLYGVVARDN